MYTFKWTLPQKENEVCIGLKLTLWVAADCHLDTYDIFLCHRGRDDATQYNMKTGFVSTLDAQLQRGGRRTFLDEGGLKPADKGALSRMNHAIINSKIIVLILSRSFPSSPWCLDELVLAMERDCTVLPVWLDPNMLDVLKCEIRALRCPSADRQRWLGAVEVLEHRDITAIRRDQVP